MAYSMIKWLTEAKYSLRNGQRDDALYCLSMALGEAKRNGHGYAAGRILTAIQWAKLVKLPVSGS